jgi:hypothetical protein
MDLFGGSSLDALVARARQKLASSDFDEAHRLVARGLERFPDAQALRETRLTIRRAQARAGMQSLKDQIQRDDDPVAHEQLIALYQEVDMPAEARRAAQAYAQAHPDRDTPHLLLGEMLLQSYFEDMQARDAHPAQEHLLRAARLNAEALKPRLLLAELYFCCGADQALAVVAGALERIAPDDDTIKPVLEACRAVPRPEGKESVEALFARVEVEGALVREPTAWPLRTRRNRDQRVKDERMQVAVRRVVGRGEAEEVAIVRRNGALIAHAGGEGTETLDPTAEDRVPEKGLPAVAAGVARTVARQVREFDLGAFKRCTIQGPFGIVVVGEVGGVLAAARHRAAVEPLRLWERLTVALEGAR